MLRARSPRHERVKAARLREPVTEPFQSRFAREH